MRLIDFIFSDDIRHEIGGKVSIMGIYNDKLSFNLPNNVVWPFPFRLGIFIRVLVEDSDQKPNRFSIKLSHNGNDLAGIDGDVKSSDGKLGTIVLPVVLNPLPLPGPGLLQANIKIFSNENILLDECPGTIQIEVINI